MAAWRSLSVSRYPVAALRVVWLYSSTAFIAQRRHQCTTSSHSTTHHCLARSADSAALSTPHSARLHTSHACHASPLISRRMPHAASLSLSQPLLLEIHLREASVASRLQILPFFLCRGETRHQLLHALLAAHCRVPPPPQQVRLVQPPRLLPASALVSSCLPFTCTRRFSVAARLTHRQDQTLREAHNVASASLCVCTVLSF
jgi:hypothetical protein